MKINLKNQKGINLITLSVAVIIILILTNIILYNVKDNLGIQNLKNMQADIRNLRDKVSVYYAQYGEIPTDTSDDTKMEYTNINHLKDAGIISEPVDTGRFLVIDLSAMENVTITYGKDYEKIKNGEATTTEEINALENLYIINENSHNIFFVRGIQFDGEWFYTDYTKENIDKESVELIDANQIEDNWSPKYDQTTTYKDINEDIAYIPEGFQVSRKAGEDTINDGLVVCAPDGSEFVWVPVDNINKMSQCQTADGECDLQLDAEGHLKCTTHIDTAEKIVGKLYAVESGENFGTVNEIYEADNGLREPDILTDETDGDASIQEGKGIDLLKNVVEIEGENNQEILENWKNKLEEEYKTMAESVAKYKGFYVGRYETSISEDMIASKKNSEAMTEASESGNSWYGLYAKQATYKTEFIQGSMMWGSQYDAMMNWMKKQGIDVATVPNEGIANTNTKITGEENSTDLINNVYDLYGGRYENTVESNGTIYRVQRGGYYGMSYSPSNRANYYPYGTEESVGSRLSLYIK